MNLYKYIIIVLIFGIFNTQTYSQHENTVQWNDGKHVHRLSVVGDTVVEFGNSSKQHDALSPIKQADRNAKVMKRGGRYRMWKMSRKQIVKDMRKGGQSKGLGKNCSPVYINNSGQQMALPGNIIIKFKKAWDADKVYEWAAGKQLIIIRKLSHYYNSYLIQSPPGEETLTLVNSLAKEDGVVSVTPNWWRPMSLR